MEGIIKRLELNKRVTVSVEGKNYHTKGGLPHERYYVRKNGKHVKLVELIESPYKRITDCDVQERCGGCKFRDLTYEDEYKIKDEELKRLSDKFDGATYLGLHTPSAIEKYRNKMEYTFGDEIKGGPLTLGLHEKGMYHNIIEGSECKIIPEDMELIRRAVKEYFLDKALPFYNAYTNLGFMRHLVIRHSTANDEYLLNLVTTSQTVLNEDELIKHLTSIRLRGKISSIYHTINDSKADAVIADEVKLLFGNEKIIEEVLGIKFPIGPFSFFQTNTAAAAELYSYVRELAGNTESLWDLYAGSAVMGSILSANAKRVTSVEINHANIVDAKEMLALNKIDNVTLVEGDCKDFVTAPEKAEIIVVDPPRTGLHPKVTESLNNSRVNRIIYVSCNPVTMVTDMQALTAYKVKSFKGFDNFRGTLNVECVAELVRTEQ